MGGQAFTTFALTIRPNRSRNFGGWSRWAKAYVHHRRAQTAIERGDVAAMKREFEIAIRQIRDNAEMRFWYAIGLLGVSEIENGIAILREIAATDRNWITLALRLKAPLLKADQEVLERIRQLG
jgi:hypothetical protein